MFLEITAEGWIAIITALGGFVTILGASVVGIIVAMNANKKADAAAVRREELAQAVLDPSVTTLPPKG